MKTNSVLSPSSAARRIACPGSWKLESTVENQDSIYAIEGTTAHWVSKEKLEGRSYPTDTHSLNGELITADMQAGAELYAAAVNVIIKRAKLYLENPILHVEETIDISNIHPLCKGTPDAWLFYPGEVHIWDYKFGFGYVDVFENWQLIEYAAGILDRLGIGGNEAQKVRVNFYIVQPRCYGHEPIRTWKIQASALQPYFEQLFNAEKNATGPEPIYNTSSQCLHCAAKYQCKTLKDSAFNIIDMSKQNIGIAESPSIGEELRDLKYAAKLLDARIVALEQEAINLIKSGKQINYFSLQQGVGRQVWNIPAKEIVEIGRIFGVPLEKPVEAITPKQAIIAGLSKEIVAEYSTTPKTGFKLVEDNLDKLFRSNTNE